ncbi:MAG: hypothetical protein FJW26_15405 [Acidimicrobiia bacterium]|nr:hypothetical protein [Acidimicrobiia bacterium]
MPADEVHGLQWLVLPRAGLVRSHAQPKATGSLFYGLVRLLMGIVFGLGIFFAALRLNNTVKNSLLTYFVVYVPVRVIEWSLMLWILRREGTFSRYLLWVGGGVILSCLADIPLGVMEGGVVPVGRPFC